MQVLEKTEWVQILTDTDKNRDLKFSVRFEKDMLRLKTDLLSKGKYKQNLYEGELTIEHNPYPSYDGGFFELNEEDREYFIVSEHKVYLPLGFISEEDEMEVYLPYYSKSKYEALRQLPTKKKMTEQEFLQVLDEIILILR